MSVTLTYTSSPAGIPAIINGVSVQDNDVLTFPTGTRVIIQAGRIIEETLTMNPPVGNGTVFPAPGTYPKLLYTRMTATPASEWQFENWTYDGTTYTANPLNLSSQQYIFTNFMVNAVAYTNNPLTLTMDSLKSVQLNYSLVDMGIVTITGNVSAQATSGQQITIVVTKPGGSTITLPVVLTTSTGAFSTTYSDVPGSYSLVAHVAADAVYTSASSAVTPFTIALTPRTITVSVA